MEQEVKVERMEPADKLADGQWVRMNGKREYLVPALTFRALRELQPQLETLKNAANGGAANLLSVDQMGLVIKVAHAALKRNYPDMTEEQVEDLVDTGNIFQVFGAIIKVSGLGEKPASGEPLAAS